MPKINILVLVKHSSYDNYFKHYKKSDITKHRFASDEIKRFKQTHLIHYETLTQLQALLKRLQVSFKTLYRGTRVDYQGFDLIITVGGDGTFLEASHFVTHQPMLGINSDPSWSVGRFCCATTANVEHYLSEHLKGKSHLQFLNRFTLKLKSQKEKYFILNDVLVCHRNPGAMSRYLLKINTNQEIQRSSGVWISTAAGSTGAIQSAGGVVIPPTEKQLQYKPRELYLGNNTKYHLRGGFFESKQTFTITSLMREGVIFVDGSHIHLPFSLGDILSIESCKFPIQMIVR